MTLQGHINLSLLLKGALIVLNLFLVPLSLKILGQEDFGLWSAIFSISQLLNFFDAGIGNGLRNFVSSNIKVSTSEYIGDGIKSAYSLSRKIITIVILLIFFSIISFYNSTNILVYLVVFISTTISLYLRLVISVRQGMQNHVYPDIFQLGNQISILIALLITLNSTINLLQFSLIYAGVPIFYQLIVNIYEFRFGKIAYLTSQSNGKNIRLAKNIIIPDSYKLFATKLGAIVMLSTDNFLIQIYHGGIESAWYSINQRYFGLIVLFFGTITGAYWSSISLKFSLADYQWVRNGVNKLIKTWILVPCILFAMFIVRKVVFDIWLGEFTEGSVLVPILFVAFYSAYTFISIFSSFVNGIGDLNLHARVSLFIAIFNVPLSLLLMAFIGVPGIMLGSIISLLFKLVLIGRYKLFIREKF